MWAPCNLISLALQPLQGEQDTAHTGKGGSDPGLNKTFFGVRRVKEAEYEACKLINPAMTKGSWYASMSSKINYVGDFQAGSFLIVKSTLAEVSGTQRPWSGAVVQGLRNAQRSCDLELSFMDL